MNIMCDKNRTSERCSVTEDGKVLLGKDKEHQLCGV